MTSPLQHKAEFETVLKTYEPSSEAKSVLGSVPLGILLGLSASGRNTIINKLLETGEYHFIVSDTTRAPKIRDGKLEQDGVNYNFRSEADILQDLHDGMFLEAEVIHNRQVSGINTRELLRAKQSGKMPINEVDIAGTVNIRKYKPDTKFIFVLPPSYDEWIRRFTEREEISDEELADRKGTAIRVLNEAFRVDDWHFVVNDDLDEAVRATDAILRGGDTNTEGTRVGRQVAREILERLTS